MNPANSSPVVTPLPDRLKGLSSTAWQMLQQADHDLRAGNLPAAANALRGAAALAPRNAEVMRMQAVFLIHRHRGTEARMLLEELLQRHPDDPVLLRDLAQARFACNEHDAGLATLRRICEVQPASADVWFILGKALRDQDRIEESVLPLERAIALAPEYLPARTACAASLVLMGRLAEARAQYLEVLKRAPDCGPAWWGLANIKTVPFSDDEVRLLETRFANPGISEADHAAMGCALGKAYEDQQRFAEAFRILVETNARISRRRPWDPVKFSAMVDRSIDCFARPHRQAGDPQLGAEVIFIVSLPRSGSTLTEQILAAHPDVEGASELGELSQVLQAESERRREDYPYWISDATADDWTRLGKDYLARTARWRKNRPISTDKLPNNWIFTGAILAMLPGTRIVNCRRDPVETCWSCFKQLFAAGNEFSYDLDYLAKLYIDYDRTMKHWLQREPARVRDQVYEDLVADPETQIRELLAFCRLPFNESVLRFHEAQRSVRSASAAQVREPLRRNTARAAGYGALLDPLREALKPLSA